LRISGAAARAAFAGKSAKATSASIRRKYRVLAHVQMARKA
jgi:hypothetical protein